MNIEESAERVKKWCEFYRLREKTNIDFLFSIAEKDIPIEAIETLLTAYEKEKEKNKKAIDFINKRKKTLNTDMVEGTRLQVGTFMWQVDELLEILKGEKGGIKQC